MPNSNRVTIHWCAAVRGEDYNSNQLISLVPARRIELRTY